MRLYVAAQVSIVCGHGASVGCPMPDGKSVEFYVSKRDPIEQGASSDGGSDLDANFKRWETETLALKFLFVLKRFMEYVRIKNKSFCSRKLCGKGRF